jgi:hypothetical protein
LVRRKEVWDVGYWGSCEGLVVPAALTCVGLGEFLATEAKAVAVFPAGATLGRLCKKGGCVKATLDMGIGIHRDDRSRGSIAHHSRLHIISLPSFPRHIYLHN